MWLDRASGATAVAEKFVDHLHKWVTKARSRSSKALIAGLEKECLMFLAGYPAMGNLSSLTNAIGFGIDRAEKGGFDTFDLVTGIVFRIEHWEEKESKAHRVIPKLAAQAIGWGKTILTLSSSELVKQTFLALKQEGAKAVVLESRPLREGEKTALDLARAGIPTSLIIDVAFPSLADEVDVVLVGADRISKTLVNKVGTKALLEWARWRKKPVLVVCQTSKFVPPAWCVLPLPLAPPDEVSRRRHPKLQVRNFYFEECPLDQVEAIITERGVLGQHVIRKKMDEVETSAWFRLLLQKRKATKLLANSALTD